MMVRSAKGYGGALVVFPIQLTSIELRSALEILRIDAFQESLVAFRQVMLPTAERGISDSEGVAVH